MTPKFSGNFACRKCEENIGKTVEQEVKLCDEVEAVMEFTYLGDRVSVTVLWSSCHSIDTKKMICRSEGILHGACPCLPPTLVM